MFYPFNLQHSICKHVFSSIIENGIDPDQMALMDLQCFPKRDTFSLCRTRIKKLRFLFTIYNVFLSVKIIFDAGKL